MGKMILLSNITATFYLTGLIWIIQVVQYPFFSEVGRENFSRYHALHSFWITPVVAPMMIIELLSAVFLLFYMFPEIDAKLFYGGLFLTVIVWLSTFFLQVPMHEKLSSGFDEESHRFLVNSNWIRTVCWSLRSVLCFYFAWKLLK